MIIEILKGCNFLNSFEGRHSELMTNFYYYGQPNKSVNSENMTKDSFLKSKQIQIGANLQLTKSDISFDSNINYREDITEIYKNIHDVKDSLSDIIILQQQETGKLIESIKQNYQILHNYEEFLTEKEKEVQENISSIRLTISKRQKKAAISPKNGIVTISKKSSLSSYIRPKNHLSHPYSENPKIQLRRNISQMSIVPTAPISADSNLRDRKFNRFSSNAQINLNLSDIPTKASSNKLNRSANTPLNNMNGWGNLDGDNGFSQLKNPSTNSIFTIGQS